MQRKSKKSKKLTPEQKRKIIEKSRRSMVVRDVMTATNDVRKPSDLLDCSFTMITERKTELFIAKQKRILDQKLFDEYPEYYDDIKSKRDGDDEYDDEDDEYIDDEDSYEDD